MTKEDKELLFKDLCARLPYGVKIQVYYEEIAGSGYFDETVWLIDNDEPFHANDRWIENIKPYLRSMSSMTEKDCLSLSKELNLSIRARGGDIYFPHNEDNTLENWNKVNNWLLKNHFDFMGLIPKGLAIEVTEQNNPYERIDSEIW